METYPRSPSPSDEEDPETGARWRAPRRIIENVRGMAHVFDDEHASTPRLMNTPFEQRGPMLTSGFLYSLDTVFAKRTPVLPPTILEPPPLILAQGGLEEQL
jgi:hypothetical protein